jgi:hypothetical protein
MRNALKSPFIAGAILLSMASFAAHAMEIRVIPKGSPYPASMGVKPGSMVCEQAGVGGRAQAIIQENGGDPSAVSFDNVTSVGPVGSSVKFVSASENNPLGLSGPGCRYITMTIDRGAVHDGEYDLSNPDSAVKVDYVQVFTNVPGQPDSTVAVTYPAEQGRAHVIYDKTSDHLSATFEFATTVEPLPRQWGAGYPSPYSVNIASGNIVSGGMSADAACTNAWNSSSASRTCSVNHILGGPQLCNVNAQCRDSNANNRETSNSGSPSEVAKFKNCNGRLTHGSSPC